MTFSKLHDFTFPVHDRTTAPEASRGPLERIQSSVGTIPNLAGAMSSSPALIEGFVALREAFARSSFSALEREVLALANATENGCRYCQAIHATFAAKSGLAPEQVERLRAGDALDDPRLDALARFTRAMILGRGKPSEGDLDAFRAAGFGAEQVLEIIAGIALSAMANYSGRMTGTEPDEAIRANYR